MLGGQCDNGLLILQSSKDSIVSSLFVFHIKKQLALYSTGNSILTFEFKFEFQINYCELLRRPHEIKFDLLYLHNKWSVSRSLQLQLTYSMGKTTQRLIKNVTINALNLNIVDTSLTIKEEETNQPLGVSVCVCKSSIGNRESSIGNRKSSIGNSIESIKLPSKNSKHIKFAL